MSYWYGVVFFPITSNHFEQSDLKWLFSLFVVSDTVIWSPDGQLYAVVIDQKMDIYDITTAAVCCSFESKKRLLSACFIAVSL